MSLVEDRILSHSDVVQYNPESKTLTILGVEGTNYSTILAELKACEAKGMDLPKNGEKREGQCMMFPWLPVTKLWLSHTLSNEALAVMYVLNRTPGDFADLPFMDKPEIVKIYEKITPAGPWVTLKFLPNTKIPKPSDSLMAGKTLRSIKNLRKMRFSLLYGNATLIYQNGQQIMIDAELVKCVFTKTPQLSKVLIVIQQPLMYDGEELYGDFKAQLNGSPICKNILHREECMSQTLAATKPKK